MFNMREVLFFILSMSLLGFMGCATTPEKSLKNLRSTTPKQLKISTNYIDAYANTSRYYQKCVARKGASYPMKTTVNGMTITTRAKNPDTVVFKELDRKNKSAVIGVYFGKIAQQFNVFKAIDDDNTQISIFYQRANLRSGKFNQKRGKYQASLLKKISTEKNLKCIKKNDIKIN